MWGSRKRLFLVLGLIGLFLLSACERTSSDGGVELTYPPELEAPTQGATLAEEASEPGLYPAPGSDNPQASDQSQNLRTYPDSHVESETMNYSPGTTPAYPAPDSANPAQINPLDSAYPAPDSVSSPQMTPPGSPYPAPGQSTATHAEAASNTPELSTPTPIPTQDPLLPLTPGAGDATQPISITQTGTPSLVRTQLEASDPATFQLASGQVQFVEFFAYWSPMSQSMAPVVFRLEDRYTGRISFAYLDIDDPANDLFRQLIDDRLPPIYYLLDGGGNVLGEWSGYVSEGLFITAFEGTLQ